MEGQDDRAIWRRLKNDLKEKKNSFLLSKPDKTSSAYVFLQLANIRVLYAFPLMSMAINPVWPQTPIYSSL